MPFLTQLAAQGLVKDRIKYFEELSDKQAPTIRLDKTSVSLQDIRDEELKHARVSKYKKTIIISKLVLRKTKTGTW